MGWAAKANRRRKVNAMLGVVLEPTPPPAPPKNLVESRHIAALREAAQAIPTLARFEEMVLLSDQPARFRALVEPMLPPGLPCCDHRWNGPHEKRCPTVLSRPKPMIVTPEQDLIARIGPKNANVLVIDDERPTPRLVGPDGKALR